MSVAALQAHGIDGVMMSGDNRATAAAIARQVGIGRVLAKVVPEHKAAEIRRLQGEGWVVGMVGNGIDVGSGPGPGRRRLLDRHRHRRRHRVLGHHTDLRCAVRSGDRDRPVQGHDVQHPPQSGVRIRVQRERHPGRPRCPWSPTPTGCGLLPPQALPTPSACHLPTGGGRRARSRRGARHVSEVPEGDRPGLRHDRRPRQGRGQRRAPRPDVLLLLPALCGDLHRKARELPQRRGVLAASSPGADRRPPAGERWSTAPKRRGSPR